MPEIKSPLKHKLTKQGNDHFTITHKHSFADVIRHLHYEGCDLLTFVNVINQIANDERKHGDF
jgi:hypothetical protein